MHHQMKSKDRWRVDQNSDGSETWTSYLGFSYTKSPRHFPMPEPLAPEDNLPAEIADRIPAPAFDPYPSTDGVPLPEPPPLGREEYQAMEAALDNLAAFGETFQQWCDRHNAKLAPLDSSRSSSRYSPNTCFV
jgi:hypothetical protein